MKKKRNSWVLGGLISGCRYSFSLTLEAFEYFFTEGSFLARLLILIKKGGLLQLKFGVVGVGVGVNIYLWAR